MDVASRLAVPLFLDGAALFFFEATDGATLIGMRVGDQAVDFAAFVVVGEVLGNGKTFLIAEEQSMAIFPLLHLLAGTDPGGGFDLFGFVFVVVAWAEGSADFVDVFGEANHEKFGNLFLRVEIGAAFIGKVLDELLHFPHVFFRGLHAIFIADGVHFGFIGHGGSSRRMGVVTVVERG